MRTGLARIKASDTLWLTACGALMAGAVHVAYVLARGYVLGQFTWTSREFPWFSPLAYFACLLLVALPLMVVAAMASRLAGWRVQATLLASVTVFAIVLLFTRVQPIALLLLSLGAGTQVARLVAANTERAVQISKRLTFTLAALLGLVGVPEIVVYRWRSAVALNTAAPTGAPNVILLILDTVRAANMGLYGYERPTTPAIDRLGQRGVVFDMAIATASWTAPSHATMVTGRYPTHTGITYLTPMHDTVPTIAERFQAAGYATGAFMGNAGYAGRQTHFDRGFAHFEDYPPSIEQAMWSATLTQMDVVQRVVSAGRSREWWRVRAALAHPTFRLIGVRRGDRSDANEIADNFIEWRDGVGKRPYFAMLNMFDAHDPYDTPFESRFAKGRTDRDKYDGAIAFEDSIVGDLMQRLGRRGDLENTIVMIVADHGEQFGEHGLTRHGNSLYLELLRVPMILVAPGRVPAGVRVSTVVSLRDVAATLLDLARVEQGAIPGVSLAMRWRDSTAESSNSPAVSETERSINQPAFFPTSFGPMEGLVGPELHYIRRGDGLERVYAWKGDTAGRGDRTIAPDGVRAIEESRATIDAMLRPGRPPRR